MSPRIDRAIIELEAAIRAESHPQAYLFGMRVSPHSSDFGFSHASNQFSGQAYNLRREEIKIMKEQVTP